MYDASAQNLQQNLWFGVPSLGPAPSRETFVINIGLSVSSTSYPNLGQEQFHLSLLDHGQDILSPAGREAQAKDHPLLLRTNGTMSASGPPSRPEEPAPSPHLSSLISTLTVLSIRLMLKHTVID